MNLIPQQFVNRSQIKCQISFALLLLLMHRSFKRVEYIVYIFNHQTKLECKVC
ncbi:hypothetical protein HanRHA438_Chr14g0677871 [Helianthus annuus]|nr:hypothetical protein HanRHA438_Chr14g0677871 [Helianthus annuus]